MSHAIFRKVEPSAAATDAATLAATFREEGALVLRGFFANDARFQALVGDLTRIVRRLLGPEAGEAAPRSTRFDDLVTTLAARDRRRAGLLYDLGTRPAKLLSASEVKLHPDVLALVRAIFGDGAIVGTPALGDTFHLFPPGAENFKFNLPMHQDYPYLIQSPAMITAWLNFGATHEDVGGITLWPRSHTLGLLPQRRTELGHLEVIPSSTQLAAFEPVDVVADVGDLVLMDGLLWHRSNRNLTSDRTRIVQLFRYTDLSHPLSVAQRWRSTEAGGGGLTLEEAHPESIVNGRSDRDHADPPTREDRQRRPDGPLLAPAAQSVSSGT